jgi:Rap1a immunity proteins
MSYLHRERVVKVPTSITNLIEIWFYRILAVAIVISLAFFAGETKAAGVFHSGNTLYAKCTSPETYDRAYCLGYLVGAVDMMEGDEACTPQGMTAGQVQDIFLKYMREHPELRDKRADHLIIVIFGTLYPCKTSNTPQARPI